MEDWEIEFDAELAGKNCSLQKLMYDRRNNDQKEVMKQIVEEDKMSPLLWLRYVEKTIASIPKDTKQAQLVRMVTCCLNTILAPIEKQLYNDDSYIGIHLQLIQLKSDEDAIKHFSTNMSRTDKNRKVFDVKVGKSHAGLYFKWTEIILRATDAKLANAESAKDKSKERQEGLVAAIKVLNTAIANNVQPKGPLKVQLKTLLEELGTLQKSFSDGVISFQKDKQKEAADGDSEEDSDEATKTQEVPVVVQPEPARRSTRSGAVAAASSTTAASAPTVSEDVRSVRIPRSAGLLGKSTRVSRSAQPDEQVSADEEDKAAAPATPAPLVSQREPTPRPAASLSVYVDDKMKNFNPVWKPKTPVAAAAPTAPSTVTTTPAPAAVVSVPAAVPRSRLPFSIADTNVDVSISAAPLSRTPAPRRSLEDSLDPLNDSVVEFKQNKRPKTSTAARSVLPSEEDIVFKVKGVAAGEDSDSTATATASGSLEATRSMTVALPPLKESSCDESVMMDGDTVAIAMPVEEPTVSMTVEGDTVQVAEPELAPVAPPVFTPKAVDTPAAKISRTQSEPAVLAKVAASPMLVSALATPVSKQKRRTRVSFAGNEDLLSDAISEPEAAGKAVTRAEMKASAAAAPATSSSSSGKNLLQNPANRVIMNGREYLQLGALGKGGSGVVTKVLSTETGSLFAYKRISISDSLEPEVIERQFEDHQKEIALLQGLAGSPLIVELVDSEIDREASTVCMVMEMGETDLAKVLMSYQSGPNKASAVMKQPLDPFFARMIWKEMLECVQYIHNKNIIHSDLKPANFVFVRGHLKLIDFGIAKSISNDTTNVYRDSPMGTLNYMSPEALKHMGGESEETENSAKSKSMRLGRSSDVWSLGCILYQMMYGRTPFSAYGTLQKMAVITDPKHTIEYPTVNSSGHPVDPAAIESIRACLVYDRTQRRAIGGATGLITQRYLTMAAEQETQNQLRSVVDAVMGAVRSTLSSTAANSTPSKRAKLDQLVGLLGGLDKAALLASVSAELGVRAEQSLDQTTDSSGDSERDQFPPRVIHRTSSSSSQGGNTAEQSRFPSTPSGKFPVSAAGQFSAAKVKRLFAGHHSSLASLAVPVGVEQAVPFSSAPTSSVAATPAAAAAALAPTTAKKGRTPLKSLPLNIQNQITASNLKGKLNSVTASGTNKWMKPAAAAQVSDMRSAMEEKLGNMRKFLATDQDDVSGTDTFTNTGFTFGQF